MPNTKTIVIAVGKEIFYPIPHRNIIFFFSQIMKLNLDYCWCFDMVFE